MEQSVTDDSLIKKLLKNALTDKINDREVFMKGIDYSYYYEEAEGLIVGFGENKGKIYKLNTFRKKIPHSENVKIQKYRSLNCLKLKNSA